MAESAMRTLAAACLIPAALILALPLLLVHWAVAERMEGEDG
jgi:hypothetical protein